MLLRSLKYASSRTFQRTKTHISENEDAKKNENAKKENTKRNTQTQKKTEDAKERISIGELYKSLQIINSSFIYKII